MTQPAHPMDTIAHPIHTIASRIARHHIGRPVTCQASTDEGTYEVAGVLCWYTHSSDDVVLAVDDGSGAVEWTLTLRDEVTVR